MIKLADFGFCKECRKIQIGGEHFIDMCEKGQDIFITHYENNINNHLAYLKFFVI